MDSKPTRSPHQLWAVEMEMVRENFRILLNRATGLGEPHGDKELVLYQRRKCQLVTSMLFYTTLILSDGMNFVMKDNVSSQVREALQNVHLLQQDMLKLGASPEDILPEDFERVCEQFELEGFHCPNPLVIYLKLALSSRDYEPGLDSVSVLLNGLNLKKSSGYNGYFPGIPPCIMALDTPEHGVIITATKDRYEAPELKRANQGLWNGQLQWLRHECSAANFGRIQKLEKLSQKFMKLVERTGIKNENSEVNINDENLRRFLRDRANEGDQKQVDLTGDNGTLATWKPDGVRFTSCLLDYYRFRMKKPSYNQGRSLRVFGATTCAEWFGYLELASYRQVELKECGLPESL